MLSEWVVHFYLSTIFFSWNTATTAGPWTHYTVPWAKSITPENLPWWFQLTIAYSFRIHRVHLYLVAIFKCIFLNSDFLRYFYPVKVSTFMLSLNLRTHVFHSSWPSFCLALLSHSLAQCWAHDGYPASGWLIENIKILLNFIISPSKKRTKLRWFYPRK